MAERSLLYTSIMVVMVLVLCGIIYYMVATIDFSGSNPIGSISSVKVEDLMSNDYLLTVGGMSRNVKLSDITLNVLNQMTPDTIDNYIGPDNAWAGSQFAFYFIDGDNSASLTDGDGLRVRVFDVQEWREIETNLVHVPTGATLVNVVFLALSPFDQDRIMYYDFSSESFKDLSGHQPDAVPNPEWPGPYFAEPNGKNVLNISKDTDNKGRYLTVADDGSLVPASRMLVQTLVMMTSDPNWAPSDTLFVGKGSSWMVKLGSIDLIRGYDYRFSINLGSQWYELDSKTKVKAGEWHAVAASYDSSTGLISLYIDGIREADLVVKGHVPIDPSIHPLVIGSDLMFGHWEGYIAYVAMSG